MHDLQGILSACKALITIGIKWPRVQFKSQPCAYSERKIIIITNYDIIVMTSLGRSDQGITNSCLELFTNQSCDKKNHKKKCLSGFYSKISPHNNNINPFSAEA